MAPLARPSQRIIPPWSPILLIRHGRLSPRIRHGHPRLLIHHGRPSPVSALASRVSCSAVVTRASDPPWRLSQCPCPASDSRTPTLPPRCYCYGAGRAFREGEVMSRIRLSSNPVITRPHLISPKPSSITPARHQILITTCYLSAHLTSVNCPISFRYGWTQASYSSFISIIKDHHLSSPFVSESPSVTVIFTENIL